MSRILVFPPGATEPVIYDEPVAVFNERKGFDTDSLLYSAEVGLWYRRQLFGQLGGMSWLSYPDDLVPPEYQAWILLLT